MTLVDHPEIGKYYLVHRKYPHAVAVWKYIRNIKVGGLTYYQGTAFNDISTLFPLYNVEYSMLFFELTEEEFEKHVLIPSL